MPPNDINKFFSLIINCCLKLALGSKNCAIHCYQQCKSYNYDSNDVFLEELLLSLTYVSLYFVDCWL